MTLTDLEDYLSVRANHEPCTVTISGVERREFGKAQLSVRLSWQACEVEVPVQSLYEVEQAIADGLRRIDRIFGIAA